MTKYHFGVGETITRIWEAGSGQPVLLLHEPGLRADWWRHNLSSLAAAGMRAISVDLPGHGFAEKPAPDGHTLDSYADFLGGLLELLDLEDVVVVASGATARMAGRRLSSAPDRVAGLLLISPLGVVEVEAQVGADLVLDITDASREGVARKFGRLFADHSVVTADWAEEEHKTNSAPGAAQELTAVAAMTDQLLTEPDPGELAKVAAQMPVQLLWGAADQVAPAQLAGQTAAVLGISPATVIDGAGHAVQYERPDALGDALVRIRSAATR